MATIKGQNLRILLGDDAQHLACVAAATSCQVHLALQVEEDTTKDTVDDFIQQEPVGINWDTQVDALVLLDNEETGVTADLLQVGRVYLLRFSQTAGAAGQQNRDAIDSDIRFTGYAILNDLQLTAQSGDVSTYTARFTGTGDIVTDLPEPEPA